MLSLTPRLNYKYTLKDAVISFKGLLNKNSNISSLTRLFGTENIYFVNHGRTGLRIALSSLGLPPNSRVGVQAFNCHTVFNAIRIAGYRHVFIDVNDNFQIDVGDLERKRNKIDGLILTHLFGIPAEMDTIRKIMLNAPIIEDCAHSFLSGYKGKLTGTIGDIGVFSIGKAKFPSIGEGGFLVVNNTDYLYKVIDRIRTLKKNSLFRECQSIITNLILSLLHQPYVYKFFTFSILKRIIRSSRDSGTHKNKERTMLQSNKILLERGLNTFIQQKIFQVYSGIKVMKKYHNDLRIKLPVLPDYINPNFFMSPLLVKEKRENIIKEYFNIGIEAGIHFSKSLIWAKSFGYETGDCKNCEKISKQIITIPTYIGSEVMKRSS